MRAHRPTAHAYIRRSVIPMESTLEFSQASRNTREERSVGRERARDHRASESVAQRETLKSQSSTCSAVQSETAKRIVALLKAVNSGRRV